MSDFDCECGFHEDDPICKCNGGPGYDSIGGGGGSRGSKKRTPNKSSTGEKGAVAAIVLLFVFVAFLYILAAFIGELGVVLLLAIIFGVWYIFTH